MISFTQYQKELERLRRDLDAALKREDRLRQALVVCGMKPREFEKEMEEYVLQILAETNPNNS